MTLSTLLPDFGTTPPPAPARNDAELEALKREAFNAGYASGRDDVLKTGEAAAAEVSAALAATLQEASFTYHEARSQLLTALRPLLTQLVELVLPDLARATLAERVAGEIAAAADMATAAEVRVHAAPETLETLERLADRNAGVPVDLDADPTLGPGQVLLQFADGERQIDLDELLEGIRSAVSGYLEDNLQEAANG